MLARGNAVDDLALEADAEPERLRGAGREEPVVVPAAPSEPMTVEVERNSRDDDDVDGPRVDCDAIGRLEDSEPAGLEAGLDVRDRNRIHPPVGVDEERKDKLLAAFDQEPPKRPEVNLVGKRSVGHDDLCARQLRKIFKPPPYGCGARRPLFSGQEAEFLPPGDSRLFLFHSSSLLLMVAS